MDKLDPTKILLSITDPDYMGCLNINDFIDSKEINKLKTILEIAEKNGLLYYFIQKIDGANMDLPFLRERLSKERKRKDAFEKTVNFLNKTLHEHKIDFVIIKLFSTVPHTPNDIDIFIRKEDKQRVISILEDNEMKCLHSNPAETKFIGKYMKTDIYTEIVYFGTEFVDNNLLMNSEIKNDFLNVKYPGLDKKADFLILLVHTLFGHRRLTLLDFLHLKNLKREVNIDECREYAYGRGWGKVFDSILDQLDFLYEKMYIRKETVNFPYIFNRDFIIKCLSKLDNFEKEKFNLLFFNISFYLEEIMYKLENTLLYKALKHFGPARNLFNSICMLAKGKIGYRS